MTVRNIHNSVESNDVVVTLQSAAAADVFASLMRTKQGWDVIRRRNTVAVQASMAEVCGFVANMLDPSRRALRNKEKP